MLYFNNLIHLDKITNSININDLNLNEISKFV